MINYNFILKTFIDNWHKLRAKLQKLRLTDLKFDKFGVMFWALFLYFCFRRLNF